MVVGAWRLGSASGSSLTLVDTKPGSKARVIESFTVFTDRRTTRFHS